MHPVTIGALSLALGLTAFAPAPLPRDKKAPASSGVALKDIQGTWALESLTRWVGGKAMEGKSPVGMEARIEGTTWMFLRNGAASGKPYDIQFDASKSPAWMDIQMAAGAGKALRMMGIVKREGDRLKFCYVSASVAGAARPTDFEPKAGTAILMTLKKK